MRAFTAPEIAANAQEVTYRGFLVEISPVGRDPIRLTTIGADFQYGIYLFKGDPGFRMIAANFTSGSDPASMDLEIPISEVGPVVTNDVLRSLYKDAPVVLRIVDWGNTGLTTPPLGFRWKIGAVHSTSDGFVRFEIRSELRSNRELILDVIGPGCKTHLGSPRCGVDVLTFWTDLVTVASSPDPYTVVLATGVRPTAVDGFFQDGAIKFLDGEAEGRSYPIRMWTQSTSTARLWQPLRTTLTPGGQAQIHAGCNKTRGAGGCLKFSNNRYQGFDHLPAADVTFRYDPPVVEEAPTTIKKEEPEYTEPKKSGGWMAAGSSSGTVRIGAGGWNF